MKTLILIRGLPGSGKSTLAKKLRYEHLEADMFFEQDGEYKFNPALLREAHQWCQERTKQAMRMNWAGIVVSNTFTQRWEMDPYLKLAREHGYTVQIIECKGKFENVHGVPAEAIEKMRQRWENIDCPLAPR